MLNILWLGYFASVSFAMQQIYIFSVFLCRDFTQDIEYDTNSTLAKSIKFLSLGAGGQN